MSNIDRRIVEMQFDNKNFESGVKTSTNSLENLKKGLDFGKAGEGLASIASQLKNFSLGNLTSNVETIASKFSALGIVGVTALVNIANQAIETGKQIVKSLSTDQIMAGFSEYELKMGSVQTIMAGSGEDLQSVNKALDELNLYADKTIYSFSDMTQNIGKFTNAGISLKDSVAAIKGVANVAAVSGANANEASRAMYNFAQALSGGAVKLIDWKSIENANMATAEFKKQLIDTAVAAGTLIDTGDGMYNTLGKNNVAFNAIKSFNESLADQWMTTEVLVKVLGDYSDETTEIGKKATAAASDVKTLTQLYDTLQESAGSGWAETWEILIGDFEEAKRLFTEINNVVSKFIDNSSSSRNELLRQWVDLGGRAKLIEAFKNAFKGLSDIVKPIKEAFKEIFPPMTAQRLVDITESLRKLTEKFVISEDAANKIKRTFSGLFAILDIAKQAFFALAHGLGEILKYLFPAGDGILNFTANLGDWLVSLDESIKKSGFFTIAIDKIVEVVKKGIDHVRNFGKAIANTFKSLGGVDTPGLDALSEKVQERLKPFKQLGDFLSGTFGHAIAVFKKLAPIFIRISNEVGEALKKLQNRIYEALKGTDFDKVLDIINSGLIAGLIVALKQFVGGLSGLTEGAGGFLGKITGILDDTRGCLEAYQKNIQAKTLLMIASAVALLAASLIALSLIDSDKLTIALTALTGLFAQLFASMLGFNKIFITGMRSMTGLAIGLIGLSLAVLLLSVAVSKLSVLNWEELAKGLTAVSIIIGALIVSAKLLESSSASMIATSAGLILFAGAIGLLAISVTKLSELDIGDLAQGLLGLGIILAELWAFMEAAQFSDLGLKDAASILIVAGALYILAASVKKLGELDGGAITKGLVAIGLVMAELWGFTQIAGGTSGLIKTAAGMIIISGAVLILSVALKKFGQMSVGEIAKSLITMALALGILLVAVNAMSGSLMGAAALLIIAGALLVLSKVLKSLAELSIGEIIKGLLTIIAMIVIFAGMSVLIAPLIPLMLGLGLALGLLGIAMLAAGGGLMLFSMALAALAVTGAAGAAALVAIVTTLCGLIPTIIEAVGAGIIAFAEIIIKGAPTIIKAFVVVVEGILDALIKLLPKVGQLVKTLVTTILDILVHAIPEMVVAGMKIIKGILQGIADHIGDVIEQGTNIIINFVTGIGNAMERVVNAAFDTVINFINGLAEAIEKKGPQLKAACKRLLTAMKNFILGDKGSFIQMGKDLIQGLIDGIGSMLGKVGEAAGNVGSTIKNKLKNILGIKSPSKVFRIIGEQSGQGMIEGLKAITPKVSAAAQDMGDSTSESLNKSLNKINTDIDLQPKIRPVVDMTDVKEGIASIFDKQQNLNVGISTDKASKAYTSPKNITVETSKKPEQIVHDERTITIHNNNYVRNDTDIDKINKKLQNTLIRHSLARGVPA